MAFRPIASLADFTALKNVRLSRKSIGMPPGLNTNDLLDLITEGKSLSWPAISAAIEEYFVKRLPCKSLEFLQLDDFEDWFEDGVVGLAKHASVGGCPSLKHVRLISSDEGELEAVDDSEVGKYFKRYHNVKSLVPKECWGKTKVRRAMSCDYFTRQADELFLRAGVLFERDELAWPVGHDQDSERRKGWMAVYPQPCTGGCGDADCIVARDIC